MADKKKVSKGVAAIEEAEFNGYFNTKKEMIYKNIIWDLLNKSHNEKNKAQKQEKMKKDDKRKRHASRTNHEEDDNQRKKKRRLSSKVNYDVLEKLMNDDATTPEPVKTERECKEEKTVERESCGEGDEVENGNENEEDEDVDYGNIYYGDEDEEEYNNYEEDYEDY
ncbi:myb-like protein X [Pistacia vera]|uniref:myb-like protein X n=1 Tax=Pistacia vera TaxID=55513 RepID=UPI001263DD03|nr:myb-like protein X [Pistacia vera]